MTDPLAEFSGEPLSEMENKKVRKQIRDQDRRDWLGSIVIIWGGYTTAAITGVYALSDQIVAVLKWLLHRVLQ